MLLYVAVYYGNKNQKYNIIILLEIMLKSDLVIILVREILSVFLIVI